MKKIIFSVTSAFCFFALTQSCNRQENLPPDASAIDEKVSTSEIDLMEKQEGVRYFKKDLLVKSEDGTSKVLMRYASTDEDLLASFLTTHAFSVVTEDLGVDSGTSAAVAPDNPKTQTLSKPAPSGRIFVEEMSKTLAVGITKYAIRSSITPETITTFKNGKTALYNYGVTELCPSNNPRTVQVKTTRDNALNNNNLQYGIIYVSYGIDSKGCVLCSWNSWGGKPWDNYNINSYASGYPQPFSQRIVTMLGTVHVTNGSYRARVNIQYDQGALTHQISWGY